MKDQNAELFKRAICVMPGGVSSPVRAFRAVGGEPLVAKSAFGSKIIDANNNSYIDFCMSFGPLILGHAHPYVIEKLKTGIGQGTSFGITNEHEISLAERIIGHYKIIDWVRFVNSGTEAVMSAIRLARAVTNRTLIIKFEGCYHGHVDSLLVKAGSGLATFGISTSKGILEEMAKHTIVLPLGNKEALQICMEKYGDKVAGIIIEGVPANNGLLIQSKDFMQEVQQIAHQYGALFILDEVITGFRIGLRGAAGYYDLKPDIITFGKIIGGGLPVGAYGGNISLKEFVAPLGPMYQAGTLSGNPLVMIAGNAVFDIIDGHPQLYSELEHVTKEFVTKLDVIFSNYGINIQIPIIGSIFWLALQNHPVYIPKDLTPKAIELFSLLFRKCLKEGIYLPPSAYEVCFMSLAHTDDILITALESFEEIAKEVSYNV